MSLLEALISVSEKAANIARICRQNQHLFELLIQEKKSSEANPRFVQDFKTLADVLIQETAKCDLRKQVRSCNTKICITIARTIVQFEGLEEYVKGEESNTFSNTLGETVYVEVQNDADATADMLEAVLNGDNEAAQLLAAEVHRDVKVEDVTMDSTDLPEDSIDLTKVGVWIDPIGKTFIIGSLQLAIIVVTRT